MLQKIILKRINKMTYKDLMEVLEAVRGRFSEINPDWEVIVLTAPKNDLERRKSVFEKAFQSEQ